MGYFSELAMDLPQESGRYAADRSVPARTFLLRWRIDELLARLDGLYAADAPRRACLGAPLDKLGGILPQDIYTIDEAEQALTLSYAELAEAEAAEGEARETRPGYSSAAGAASSCGWEQGVLFDASCVRAA